MDVFELRTRLVADYAAYIRGFIHIREPRLARTVETNLEEGLLWPEPLIQLNPSFEPGEPIEQLVAEGLLHAECSRIFRTKKRAEPPGIPLRLHRHQAEAIRTARTGRSYVLTTGTGSGKSLAYIVPIVDHVLRQGPGRGIAAIVVYPMNALANSQAGELEKFLRQGYPDGRGPVSFARYTGQESDEERQAIIGKPPDILLTNYVMLELLLTRPYEKRLIDAAKGIRFLVLDEMHTYRGRQGADVALLVRRVRDRLEAEALQCVGTSATLAGKGTFEEQRQEVARVASLLFGAEVRPGDVIGETLRRATPPRRLEDPAFVAELRERLQDAARKPPAAYHAFTADPLSTWIESTLGITADAGSDRLVRSKPRPVSGRDGCATDLNRLTGVDTERCIAAIHEGLLAGYRCENPDTGFPAFAFRLHQFISPGQSVYASLGDEAERHITVQGQQFVPGDRSRILLPLVFCRDCGQEYYCIRLATDEDTGKRLVGQRDLGDQSDDDDLGEAGFLYRSAENPWPERIEDFIDRLPDEWVEADGDGRRVRKDRRPELPRALRLAGIGREEDDGLEFHYLRAPFRFCLACGVAHDFRQRSDYTKLATLGRQGRSTATTILSLSAVRQLRAQQSLKPEARKLLSFTDNRQDASLQAGHFNDFVEIGLLRSALFKACADAGERGIPHEELTQRVFAALALPVDAYAADPTVRFQARADTDRALRDVLGYRLYRDLERGWRVTSPNLEQTGLLEIDYLSLDDLCAAEDVWRGCHPALGGVTPQQRRKICRTLLDYLRRELAIKVDYLTDLHQERILQQSSQRLKEPWALDDKEKRETARTVLPRSIRAGEYRGLLFLSPRGAFGQYLRRPLTFADLGAKLSLDDTKRICLDLLEALRVGGLVERVQEPGDATDVPGFQVLAASFQWRAGDGTRPFHDPLRVPRAAAGGGRTNPFFLDFYRRIARETLGLEAREHTAQVPGDERQKREDRFRTAALPVLYCSPTMELGVDIAELNAVNMRNIPPTPANYAQRSGRAGRSGQPALVFSFCATGSPHDQYFFKRPERMVAGAVTSPRLDLANEDLVRAHVHAVWLAETGQSLGKSLCDVLDLAGGEPTLDLQAGVRDAIGSGPARQRARERARHVLSTIGPDLLAADWYVEGWLDAELTKVGERFDRAANRWRGLFRAAATQREVQNRVIGDASRSTADKAEAKRLRREAEAQLELLTQSDKLMQSDFYSYRYFASEGFLPGYSFPRLPLSAYIPGQQARSGKDEYLQRPRFLAITEFGPKAIVYHEGSRYAINKVILPVAEEGLLTSRLKQCTSCGYLHPLVDGPGPDLCRRCRAPLPLPLNDLFRLENVSTRRRARINSDEEERLRMGYEVRTGIRYAERDGHLSVRTAEVWSAGEPIARLSYGPAATIWRINMGWARRKNKQQLGFVLDLERGYWGKHDDVAEDDEDDPMSGRTRRVIPFVEDRRNVLVLEPARAERAEVMASLQSALKTAIQVRFQLEDSELAVEPLPGGRDRRLLLFYEAAEGGAGVLRRLVEEEDALPSVALEALRLCHFDPETGEDRRHAPGAREDCEAACYDCLLSYMNQPDHRILDRKTIVEWLRKLRASEVRGSPGPLGRSEHLARLRNQAGSELEKRWLKLLDEGGHRLPSDAQVLMPECQTRPDFLYRDEQIAIYIDGPVHDYPERQQRDAAQTKRLEDLGYMVLRFRGEDDWPRLVAAHADVFGKRS